MDYLKARPTRMKSRRQENTEETRVAIIAVARRHFARNGYSGTGIAKIAVDARVTTGAIYHHFAGKRALFQAVAEQLELDILKITSAVEETDPWLRIQAGFERLIDLCASPEVQRITFIEAPQVFGPEEWRAIELRYAYGGLRHAMTALVAAKVVRPYSVDYVARTLLALLHESSAEVARSKRDPTVRKQVSELVKGMFGLLTC